MFIDYLINVVLVAAPYWLSSVLIFAIGFIYCRNKTLNDFWSPIKIGSGFLIVFGLVMGMTSAANTYKNTVDYNRYQDQTMIEQRRESQHVQPIVDRTRQPLTEEELKEREVDMRERVNLNPGN